VREIISVLYQTKEINAPYFFAFSFSIGVYLPLLSPIVFPPLLALLGYLKLKKVGRNAKSKVKTD
jgi:hypothetical protein